MKIKFAKYQGTGNDFILVDDREKTFPADQVKLIESLCDRRFGVGADGLILLQNHANGDFYMQYFNSDGKESSMCGNGGRCITQFAFDLGLVKEVTTFYAIDGIHQAKSIQDSNANLLVSLQMMNVPKIEQRDGKVFVLNTGSPHFVKFVSEPVSELNLLEEARLIRYNPEFSNSGINVNFVNLVSLKEITIRTYERGVEDETFSCGTGATASALSTAVFNNLHSGVHQVKVKVNGGDLVVRFTFQKDNCSFSDIWLEGPARMVYEGAILTA